MPLSSQVLSKVPRFLLLSTEFSILGEEAPDQISKYITCHPHCTSSLPTIEHAIGS
jgi:hypothetical protein